MYCVDCLSHVAAAGAVLSEVDLRAGDRVGEARGDDEGHQQHDSAAAAAAARDTDDDDVVKLASVCAGGVYYKSVIK